MAASSSLKMTYALFDLVASPACPHRSPTLPLQKKVVASVRMALRAMGFLCIRSARGVAPKDINFRSNLLKVFWVYAKAHSAQVINLKPSLNRAHMHFVRKAMGVDVPGKSLGPYRIVSVEVNSTAGPKPASIGLFDLCHKALAVFFNDFFHSQNLFSSGLKCKTE